VSAGAGRLEAPATSQVEPRTHPLSRRGSAVQNS